MCACSWNFVCAVCRPREYVLDEPDARELEQEHREMLISAPDFSRPASAH